MKRSDPEKQLNLKILNVKNKEELEKNQNLVKMKYSFPHENLLFDNSIISEKQLAVIFQVAPRTIRYWVAINKLPHVKIGHKTMFLGSSLKKWLTNKETPLWE